MTVCLEITVKPASGRLQMTIDSGGRIKCFLKSTADKGKANRELVAYLAKLSKIPTANISIISGATARKKLIKCDTDLSQQEIIDLLKLL